MSATDVLKSCDKSEDISYMQKRCELQDVVDDDEDEEGSVMLANSG